MRDRLITYSVRIMPSQEHDVLAELFRWQPELAATLVTGLGHPLPKVKHARTVSESFTDLKTSEYTSDVAVALDLDAGDAHGVVVEIQRNRDDEKPWTWPLYVATLRARQKCPVMLLVIAPDPKVADWCARPIETGHPGHTLTPLVLRPEHVPVMTDPKDFAADPPMGILSAMFHGSGPEGKRVLRAASEGTDIIADTDRQLARRYVDCALAVLSEAARKALEIMMTTESRFYSETFRNAEAKGKAEGKAEGEAHAVLTILRTRGVELTHAQRELITGCTDLDQLETWLRHAATADSAHELFG